MRSRSFICAPGGSARRPPGGCSSMPSRAKSSSASVTPRPGMNWTSWCGSGWSSTRAWERSEVFDDLSDLYQQVILDHCKKPRNFRELSGATCSAQGYNPLCGDQLKLYLAMDGEIIKDISFTGSGCCISKASASLLTDAVKGKTKGEVQGMFDLVHEMVMTGRVVGDMGKLAVFAGVHKFPARVKCAILAWHAVIAALKGEGLWVSGDFFRVLGVPAIQGRVFTRDEDRRGTGPLAVISYNFWKRNFPGEDSLVGKTVRLNRHTFEIVGVTPPWFRGLDTDWGFDVAIPIACDPIFHPGHSALDERAEWWLRILGRMPAGESIERARDRMRAIAPEIFRATVPHDFPTEAQNQYLNNSFFLKPAATGFSEMGAQYRTALFTLMAIVGVVLLIACANIANLLLARAAARQREFSVRMAIGAGRARVIRQLMTESLLLSMFGTAAGLLLASWGGRVLVHFLSTKRHPLDMDLSLDPRVLAFTIGAAILTAVLFGLAPALRATRVELKQVMKENARGALRASGRFNPGKALVAGQVALSLMLLVAAGLFLGTLRNLWAVDPGFTRHNILIITADAEQAAVPAAKRANTYREILGRLRALPGVAAAASSVLTPISPEGWAQMEIGR